MSAGSCGCPKDVKTMGLKPGSGTRLLEECQQGSKSLASPDELQALGWRGLGTGVAPASGPQPLGLCKPCRTLSLSSSKPVARLFSSLI